MRRPTAAAVLALVALARAADPPTFQANLSLVRADVYVYDRQTQAAILDLAATDFRVLDEDEPREIVSFGSESVPLDLVFLLDVSGSVRDALPKVADSVTGALSVLEPADRAAVMAFSKKTLVTQGLSADFVAVARGIRDAASARIGLDTDINQAIWSASDYLHAAGGSARRAILALTDNSQETRVPDSLVDEQLSQAGAVVAGLLLRGPIALPHVTHSGILRFARNTGGEVLKGNQPAARLAEMIRRIKLRYSLHFRPAASKNAAPRRIRVELAPGARLRYPNAAVRSRRIYFPHGEFRPKPQVPAGQTIAHSTETAAPIASVRNQTHLL